MADELRLDDALNGIDVASGMDVAWSNDRSANALAGMHRKRRRRVATRVGVMVAAVAMIAGGSYRMMRASTASEQSTVARDTPPPSPQSRAVVLSDGSTVTPLDDAEPIEVIEDSAAITRVRLRAGKSTFKVKAADKGKVLVVSHGVKISVYASEFSASGSADSVEVWVEKGHLDVSWGDQTRRVQAGEHARFSAANEDIAINTPPASESWDAAVAEKPAKVPAKPRKLAAPDGTWRTLARKGKYGEAYEALQATGPRAVRDQIADLMLAADVARISGHPKDALRPLRRVMTKFPRDPRAPLAAFTRGRILLDKLGRAAAAARAFSKARSLAPRGALAEDALAREVESWSRAGNKANAKARARLYLERYPNGHRARAVKNYAGL